MPTSGLPTDPNDVLAQILNTTPASSPYANPERDAYVDRGPQEAILHYAVTGQMPETEKIYPSGIIQALGQRLGLSPTSQPLTQFDKDRALGAKQLSTQQDVARKLAEIQAIGPQAQYFGSDFGNQVLKTVDPRLVGAFPTGEAGKGQAALMAIQQKSEAANQEADIKQLLAQGKLEEAHALAEASGMRAEAAMSQAGAAQERAGMAEESVQLQREKLEAAPWLDSVHGRLADLHGTKVELLKQLYSSALGMSPEAIGARTADIKAQLKTIQDSEAKLYDEIGEGPLSRAKAKSRKSSLGETTITGPPPSPAGSVLPPGIFR